MSEPKITPDSTGGGDPQRVVRLLWRDSLEAGPRRGPVAAFTVDQVVDQAIAIADASGLSSLTMRSLAAALEIAPMSLYRYVPSRAELVDLMFDRVCARMAHRERYEGDLRERLAAIAGENKAMYESHPWAATVVTGRPSVGPGQTGKYDRELRGFRDSGLGDVEIDAALGLLLGFVRSSHRDAVEADAVRAESGLSDEQWWRANGPLLAGLVDPERYPAATRIGAAAGERHGGAVSAGHAYRFGLDRVIEGIVALSEEKPTPGE